MHDNAGPTLTADNRPRDTLIGHPFREVTAMPEATNTPNTTPANVDEVKTYLKATLKDGRVVVSAFSKLANIQKYAAQVFARMNVFNAWHVVARVHPTSGEPCLVRQRVMISGDQINEIVRVVPMTLADFDGVDAITRESLESRVDNLDPQVFKPAIEIQGSQFGLWRAPTTDTPEGATPGMQYPVHVDATTLERFVILRVARDGQPELRYSIEAQRSASNTTIEQLIGRTIDDDEGGNRASGPRDGDDDVTDADFERLHD